MPMPMGCAVNGKNTCDTSNLIPDHPSATLSVRPAGEVLAPTRLHAFFSFSICRSRRSRCGLRAAPGLSGRLTIVVHCNNVTVCSGDVSYLLSHFPSFGPAKLCATASPAYSSVVLGNSINAPAFPNPVSACIDVHTCRRAPKREGLTRCRPSAAAWPMLPSRGNGVTNKLCVYCRVSAGGGVVAARRFNRTTL